MTYGYYTVLDKNPRQFCVYHKISVKSVRNRVYDKRGLVSKRRGDLTYYIHLHKHTHFPCKGEYLHLFNFVRTHSVDRKFSTLILSYIRRTFTQ